MSETLAAETVYVTANEDSHVMSEKVQTLAGSIYKEFEKVIKKYDEDVVKDLMPLVVGILEALDAAFAEKQELDVELELYREDNEQLLNQYEREKQLRKAAEQKYLELEDAMEGMKKELEDKVETLESIIRMSEIKSKNTSDLVNRLEEREQEAKSEYNKLHERYTELFRTYMDYVERTKVLFGTEKATDVTISSPRIMKGGVTLHSASLTYSNTGPASVVYSSQVEAHKPEGIAGSFHGVSHQTGNTTSLRSELDAQTLNRGSFSREESHQFTDSINITETVTSARLNQTLAEIIASTPELKESHDSLRSQGHLDSHSSLHNNTSVFEEIQATDIAEVDFGAGISDSDKEEEDDDEESREIDRDSVGDNFMGMCKELENLISENVELLATKNALNVVKDDLIAKIDILTSEQDMLKEEIVIHNSVRKKLQDRISLLEDEVKKLKEELGKKETEHVENEEEEQDDVPMAHRKRFTRVEMARVLMERNQYKERLMELQEAVRWTEMMRASKEHPELEAKKKTGVWNFFGNLFSSTNKTKQNHPGATPRHSAPTINVQPNTESSVKKQRGSIPKSSSADFFQDDINSEKARKEREKERRDQYKQVRALVKKDDGRMQAYGWSLPAKFTTSMKDSSEKFQLPVPVPIFCRPLFESDDTGWKIWCAAGVNLTGNKTRIYSSAGGTDVSFFDLSPETDEKHAEGDNLDKELKDQAAKMQGGDNEQMSSLVWVCTSKHDSSQVSVIDANNPAEILETFFVAVSHILFIASVPGALGSDFPLSEEILNAEIPTSSKKTVVAEVGSPARDGGVVRFVEPVAENADPLTRSSGSFNDAEFEDSMKQKASDKDKVDDEDFPERVSEKVSDNRPQQEFFRDESSPTSSLSTTPHMTSGLSDRSSPTDPLPSGRSSPSGGSQLNDDEKSRVFPTMWMGTQSGRIYIHSSVSNWSKCLHAVRLRDSVLCIVHVKGRVLVSLADGTVVVFQRAADKQWDLLHYKVIDFGQLKQSIRCMTVVGDRFVWCGYGSKIHIICPQSMAVEKSFEAHPRKESQVRQMCWVGDGVWVSVRLDSTLRLYHAYTHQHLQDVDVEPYVSKMLGTGKLGFAFVRITAMLVSCKRLWIGTGNGVIISVPLSENNKQPMIATSSSLDGPSGSRPGGIIRVYSDSSVESQVPSTFIPYCSMAQAQLSFHGHKDAVKFFVSVPAGNTRSLSADSELSLSTSSFPTRGEAVPAPPSSSRLIMSGGEGYIDFRFGIGDEGDATAGSALEDDEAGTNRAAATSRSDSSHIIVWQVTQE